MVDPTKGIGGVSNVTSTNKSQSTSDSKAQSSESGSSRSSGPVDEVRISDEALSLRQAEDTARDIRAQLENSENATLSGSRAGALEDLLA